MAPLLVALFFIFSTNADAMECKTSLMGAEKSKYVDQLVKTFKSEKNHISQSAKEDQKKLNKLVKLSGCLSLIDPSGYAGELIFPIYEKNQTETLKEMNQLPERQSQALQRQIKVFQKVKKSGNG